MPAPYEHIFIYNKSPSFPDFFRQQLKFSNLQTFDTNNLYQLLQYTKEILPQILVINQDFIDDTLSTTLDYIYELNMIPPAVIILIKTSPEKFFCDSRIAKYLSFPQDRKAFTDFLESYDLGNRNHQILLLSSYKTEKSQLLKSLDEHQISYFEVHTLAAAKLYLEKNTPQMVCIQSAPQFSEAIQELRHRRIFYVDIDQDITEIRHFLN